MSENIPEESLQKARDFAAREIVTLRKEGNLGRVPAEIRKHMINSIMFGYLERKDLPVIHYVVDMDTPSYPRLKRNRNLESARPF